MESGQKQQKIILEKKLLALPTFPAEYTFSIGNMFPRPYNMHLAYVGTRCPDVTRTFKQFDLKQISN